MKASLPEFLFSKAEGLKPLCITTGVIWCLCITSLSILFLDLRRSYFHHIILNILLWFKLVPESDYANGLFSIDKVSCPRNITEGQQTDIKIKRSFGDYGRVLLAWKIVNPNQSLSHHEFGKSNGTVLFEESQRVKVNYFLYFSL